MSTNNFDAWINGVPIVQGGNDSGDFSAWFQGAPVIQTAGAHITTLTPDTGTLQIDGQQVYLRPIIPDTGALTLDGRQPAIGNTITPDTGSCTLTGYSPLAGTSSLIISAEYVGDGSSPRTFSFTPFSGFSPLVVIVIGKDGSGFEVGAIKTGTMPSGISQPLLTNQAAAASSRANRILDLTTNGFTVGSDLNVSGRNYAFIVFPDGRPSTVSTVSFTGPGGKSPVNSTLFVPSGAGTISGTGVFTATGDEASGWSRPIGSTVYSTGVPLIVAGRRLIRNSDGAVIAEVTAAIDADSATGIGYITGSFAGTTWHWEEYYVGLQGQVADMVFLMADDATGSPGLPLTIVKPSEMPGANADWAGIGYGELDVFLASDTDTALHILNRSSGGALTKGVVHHVITFHDDEAATGLKLHTFTWTGTGPLGTPPTLSGMDFEPAWAFVFSNNTSSWSKNSTSILTNLRDRRLLDGSGDSATNALVSWDSGGVTLTAGGDWNGNGAVYLGIFLAAESAQYIQPAAAALVLDGQQPILNLGITPDTGSVVITGYAPEFPTPTISITPDTGALTVTGGDVTLELGLPQSSGSVDLTGYSPTILINFFITPDTGAVVVTGQTPGVTESTVTTPGTGSLSVDGQGITEELGLFQESGTLDLTGYSPTILLDIFITPNTGAADATGEQPPVGSGLPTDTGTLTLTGYQPILSTFTPITPDTGAVVVTGQQPIQDLGIVPSTGALTLTGQTVEISTGETLITPNTGSLTVTGNPLVQTPLEFGIVTQTGTLTLDGQSVLVQSPGTFIADTGEVAVSGNAPILEFGIVTDTGAVAITGNAPVIGGVFIIPDTGQLVVIGQQVSVQNIVPGTLLVIWNDRSKLSVVLPVFWDVFANAPVGILPVTWNDLETLLSLPVTWRVIPDLIPAFSADIQQPVATVEEVP